MHAMNVGFIAGLMVMALAGPAAASAPVRVITDAPGDANGLANNPGPVKINASTPASDAPMDLTGVSLWRDHTALNIRFELSGAPDMSGPQSIYSLVSSAEPCPSYYSVALGRLNPQDPPAIVGMVNRRPCAGPLTSEGVTATTDGAAVVLRLPFATLHAAGAPAATGAVLGGLTADTQLGTIAEIENTGEPQFDAFMSEPIGALVDATDTGTDYTIPEDEAGS